LHGEIAFPSQRIDFVQALAKEGRVIPVYDLDKLENVLKNVKFSSPEQKK